MRNEDYMMQQVIRALQNCCSCDTKRETLDDCFKHLIVDHESDSTQLLRTASLIKQFPNELAFLPIAIVQELGTASAISWLKLLKVVLSDDDFVRSDLWDHFLYHTLLKLLEINDARIVPVALEVLILFFKNKNVTVASSSLYDLQLGENASEAAWHSVYTIVTEATKSNADIYKAWVQWLMSDTIANLGSTILLSPAYAQCIKTGMQTRSQEIQKLCLYILRQSNIMLARDKSQILDEKKQSSQHVNRYCRAYETIIMGGYALQALECLQALSPELLVDIPSNELSIIIDGRWWILLVQTSLVASKSDSTRRNVGNWILTHNFECLRFDGDFASFLQHIFLPWAYQTQYFLETTKRVDDSAVCEHGNQLEQFIGWLLSAASDSMARELYLEAVMRSLCVQQASGHGRAYVLKSIVTFFLKFEINVDQLDINSYLLKVRAEISKQALTKSQRQIIGHLIDFLDNRKERPVLNGTGPFENSLNWTVAGIKGPNDTQMTLKSMFEYQMRQCGFAHACSGLRELLRHKNTDVAAMLLNEDGAAFEFIWAESTRQRHSREALICLPDIFVADMVMVATFNTVSLRRVVFEVIEKISDLAQTRIYIWVCLTRQLHRTFNLHSDCEEFVVLWEKLFRKYVRLPPVPSPDHLLNCAMASAALCGEENAIPSDLLLEDGLGHAYMFDVLNRLESKHRPMAVRLFKHCLSPWSGQDVKKKKSLVALQASILLARGLLKSGTELGYLKEAFLSATKNTKSPRYMFLLEFAIITCFWHCHTDVEAEALKEIDDFDRLILDDELTPKEIASRLKIYVQLASHPKVGVAFIDRVMSCLPAFCASPKVSVRFEALYTVVGIMNIAQVKNIDSISTSKIYRSLHRLASSLLQSRGLPGSRQKEVFNASTEQDLVKIFSGEYLCLEEASGIIIIPEHFHQIEQHYQQEGMALPDIIVPIGQRTDTQGPDTKPVSKESTELQTDASANITYQSKYMANLNLDIAPIPIRGAHEVILVASLIDSPYNLGGLCRAAEIYACSELHIPKLSILEDRAFTSVAVSSESHICIRETPPADLARFLRSKRKDGFTIVGVEQTDSSIVLGAEDTKLPAKAVVLVGAESTGIPADVLVDCDVCVEIKQWGLTRSLNVQTAAATVLYEWRKQHG